MSRKFDTYDEFFLHYLGQHSDGRNRLLHACGTVLGLAVVVAALWLRHPWFALLFIPVGYSFAWVGHLVLERNKPATWDYPWWSFISDFRMLGLMLTGKIGEWMRRAEKHASAARQR
jgi:hypothetical protein